MTIVLHEREYAEQLLESDSLGQHPSETLTRIAKLCIANGYSKSDTRKILERHIVKCLPDANMLLWNELIEKDIRFASKYPLVDIDYVPVYSNELKICDSLDGVQMRRLMFTLICLARYSNMVNSMNNNWVNRQEKDILNLANLEVSIKRRSLMFNALRDCGLIGFSHRVDNLNVNVKCLSDPEVDILTMRITDFRNLGYQYMCQSDVPSLRCSVCGATIPRKNNRQMYCRECAKEVNRMKAVSRYRKHCASL